MEVEVNPFAELKTKDGDPVPTFIPRNDTVIVMREEVGLAHGLVRPGTAKTKYKLYSRVVAVGPKVEDLAVGDYVIGLFSGAVPLHTELPIYGMSEDVVIAKVEGGGDVEALRPKEQKAPLVQPVRGPLPPSTRSGKRL